MEESLENLFFHVKIKEIFANRDRKTTQDNFNDTTAVEEKSVE